ncbi:MAG TPA: hypothetical protein VNY73_09675 [Bacteroidia bacterium]|jgi:hypothetical protein|nr:hypothetical protein [Bacteroidia bacterium]
MNTYANKTQENKSQSAANSISKNIKNSGSAFQFVDNRPETIAQKKLMRKANEVSQPELTEDLDRIDYNDHLEPGNNPIQRVKLLPDAKYMTQPSDQVATERGQAERSEGLDELHSFHGSFRPEKVDQTQVSRDEIIKAVRAGPETWINESDGALLTGTFDFVILPEKHLDGAIFLLSEEIVQAAKTEGKQLGHTSIMRGIRASEDPNALSVTFAGMISFSKGIVIEWNGQSGHYMPPDLRRQTDTQGGSFIHLPMRSYIPGTTEDIVDDDLVKFLTPAIDQIISQLSPTQGNIPPITPDILKPIITRPPFFLAATRRTAEVFSAAFDGVINSKHPSQWVGCISGIITKYFRKYKDTPDLIDGREKKQHERHNQKR